MKIIDGLRPHESHRVIDLVAAAGVDVTPWGVSSKGKVQIPASNPAYCYEWAFTEPGKLIVLNVWYQEIKEGNGIIWCDLNPRVWAEEVTQSSVLQPSERGTLSMRALRMDEAIATAHKDMLPVRVIIGEGSLRNLSEPKSKASRMTIRLLDPEPWTVERYNPSTGDCHLVRGTVPLYVGQFTKAELPPSLSDLTSPTAIKRAIEECDRLGRERFLSQYGFGHAREYTLRYLGGEYDSKAIVGVAHGYQFPERGTLTSSEFSGGISSSGAATKAFDLGFDVDGKHRRPTDWTLSECEAAVDVYFDGLRRKLAGQSFNRAQACRSVGERIGRPQGAVDYKFQNIDAVLYKHGLPRMMNAIAANIQHLLEFVVLDPLAKHNAVFETVPEQTPSITSIEGLLVEPPNISQPDEDSGEPKNRVARKSDYAKRDANNRRLGQCGEEWVVSLEKQRLTEAGRKDLADQIDWVASRLGDGLGYDILSFNEDGAELYVEVKTTNAGIQMPFFITANELAVSKRKGESYRLYRVFDFSTKPRAYVLSGTLEAKLELKPQVFTAIPLTTSRTPSN